MLSFIVRRLAGGVVAFVVVTLVVFTITFALPGDPARVIVGRRNAPESTLAAVRRRYDLDRPLAERYLRWLWRLVHGDLGESFAQRRSVAAVITEALPTTITLIVITLLIEITVAVLVASLASAGVGGRFDRSAILASTIGLAAPLFVVASTAQWALGVRAGWAPVAGDGNGWSGYVLPACVLALPGAAIGFAVLRSEAIDQASHRHVVVARSKGVGEVGVFRRHVLRNAMTAYASFLGLEIGALAGGSIVVERVFNLPGVGGAMAEAIGRRDGAVIVGLTVFVAAAYILVDVVVDVVSARLDPRISLTRERR